MPTQTNPNYLVDAIRRQQAEIDAAMSVVPVAATPDQMLTPKDLGGLLSVSPRTIASWRTDGRGPPVTLICNMPRYRYADVLQWISEQQVSPD